LDEYPHIDESVLTETAKVWLEVDFQEHLITILHYLSMWEHLNYAFFINAKGESYTSFIGPLGQKVNSIDFPPQKFHLIARLVNDYLYQIKQGQMTHLTIELSDQMLFLGAIGDLFLVVSLRKNSETDDDIQKVAERIENLKTILRLPKE